jgi:hypothetical protein
VKVLGNHRRQSQQSRLDLGLRLSDRFQRGELSGLQKRTSRRRSALRQVAVRVLVRFDHVACFIVNANHTVVSVAVEFRVAGAGDTLPIHICARIATQ